MQTSWSDVQHRWKHLWSFFAFLRALFKIYTKQQVSKKIYLYQVEGDSFETVVLMFKYKKWKWIVLKIFLSLPSLEEIIIVLSVAMAICIARDRTWTVAWTRERICVSHCIIMEIIVSNSVKLTNKHVSDFLFLYIHSLFVIRCNPYWFSN